MALVQSQAHQSHWVQMHIPGDPLQPCLLLNEDCFESTFKQMAASAVSPVKPDTIAHVEPLDRTAEISLGRFQDQMVVVEHEHIGMEAHAESGR